MSEEIKIVKIKECSKCEVETEECGKNFYFRNDINKYGNECKVCIKKQRKKYRETHKDKIKKQNKEHNEKNKDQIKKQKKEHYEKNKDQIKKQRKENYEKNKDQIKKQKKKYYEKNKEQKKEYSKKYQKTKRANDPDFKLRMNISASIRGALKSNNSSKSGASCLTYLDYTIKDLKNHLQEQFESWMTWENQGIYKLDSWDDNDPATWKWNLDHIIPQSHLLYSSMEEENFKKCWSLENLRPLCAKVNITKSDKIGEDIENMIIEEKLRKEVIYYNYIKNKELNTNV